MIKRLTTLLLTKVYIITVLGFALNLHYCGSVLAAVNISSPTKAGKTAPITKKCCKDKEIDVKIKDAHQGQSSSFLSGLFGFDIPKIPFGDYILSAQQSLLEKLSDPAPPPVPVSKIDPVIKNRTLRI